MTMVNKCCCCFSLRTGGVIIGWLGLVFSILDAAGVIGTLLNLNNLFDEREDPESYANSMEYTRRSLPIVLASALLGILAYSMLIAGAVRGNRFLLLPWLLMAMMGIIGSALLVLVVGSFFMYSPEYGSLGVMILIVGFSLIVLNMYWWLCVFSLYQELREASTGIIYSRNQEQAPLPICACKAPPPYNSFETV